MRKVGKEKNTSNAGKGQSPQSKNEQQSSNEGKRASSEGAKNQEMFKNSKGEKKNNSGPAA